MEAVESINFYPMYKQGDFNWKSWQNCIAENSIRHSSQIRWLQLYIVSFEISYYCIAKHKWVAHTLCILVVNYFRVQSFVSFGNKALNSPNRRRISKKFIVLHGFNKCRFFLGTENAGFEKIVLLLWLSTSIIKVQFKLYSITQFLLFLVWTHMCSSLFVPTSFLHRVQLYPQYFIKWIIIWGIAQIMKKSKRQQKYTANSAKHLQDNFTGNQKHSKDYSLAGKKNLIFPFIIIIKILLFIFILIFICKQNIAINE